MVTDDYGQQHPRAQSGARIVSLVPSITELLFALDLADAIVGRTGFCIHPKPAINQVTKLGGTKDVDVDALLALKPSHVIVNIDENNLETYEALRPQVPHVIVTHPQCAEDNLKLYQLLGYIFDRQAQALKLCRGLQAGLNRIKQNQADFPLRKVLYLIWRDPWMGVSADTYIARMLGLINWQLVQLADGSRYPQIKPEELSNTEAEMVLLSSEPYPFRDKHIAELNSVCSNKPEVRLVDGEMLSWYGNRAISGLDYLTNLAATAGATV